MSARTLQASLLRPPVLHILRAAGFHSTRSAVLDSLVDLAGQYLQILANAAAAQCAEHQRLDEPQLEDIRIAMEECGVFKPQLQVTEEDFLGEEDLRGVEAFIEWAMGDRSREIRRIAALGKDGGKDALSGVQISGTGTGEDFLTTLKKKHNKTGDESRYQGTALGKPASEKPVRAEGGPVGNIQSWREWLAKGKDKS